MDHKSWPWKKTSTEKTMIPVDRVNVGSEDETNLTNTVEPQTNLKLQDENLSAVKGWEKAESEVLALKQELEKATQQREALNECMLQLRFVREEQEKKIHDDLMKTSNEHEKKIAELNKKVSNLELENSQLIYSLSSKEKLINELHSVRAQLDYDLSAVVGQLESTQRENASLSYEVRVLEKELEIRNEEREFNRRTSDVAHKQYLGSVKKIAQLETEAQRLRSLLQKRLPGPADVAKMQNEVDLTRRKSNPFPIASKITFLTEQLCSFEEENRLLKEFLNQKSKSQTVIPATSSDMGSDEKVSMVGSWAPSCNTVNASDIGLMDDFVEMEKLALEDMKKNETLEFNNSGVNKSIQRLIEIIEGVKLCKKDDILSSSSSSSSTSSSSYTVHIFQWKLSEIRDILEGFLKNCNELLNGKVGMEEFCKELTFALEWIVNHCFSLQDVSSMKDEIKKHFESEVEGGPTTGQTDKFDFPKDQLPGWPMAASWNVMVGGVDKHPIKTIEECSENHQENNTIPNEERITGNDIEKHDLEKEKDEKALPSEKEIMEASEKLAECQETILNLGKQLKALSASPEEETCEITVSPLPSPKRNSNQRISLLDKMITEDATGALRSQKSKGLDSNLSLNNKGVMSPRMFVSVDGVKDEKDEEALVNFLSIVTNKKKSGGGGGILRRLFGRKKSFSSK